MGNYDNVEVQGAERERALNEVSEQIAQWGLTMPDVQPVVLDFGLGEFPETGETEFWIANEEDSGYCGKFLFLFDGQTCPRHYHDTKHETFFIVKGKVKMVAGEEESIMAEGDTLAMAPGSKHRFTAIGPALVLEVSMPSMLNDNFFDDKDIGEDGVI